MKTVAYFALHYGKEYLAYAVRSVQDAVDEIYIFYTDKPSYVRRRRSSMGCPDTREELKAEVERFATKPVHWIEHTWNSETAHREYALDYVRGRGAQIVLVVDADEVWAPGAAQQAIDYVCEANSAANWRAKFTNFWRSIHWVVTDAMCPVRVVDLRQDGGEGSLPAEVPPILHFGYAQCEVLTEYKWTCHGHQSELRPGWLARFKAWTPGDPGDLHPVQANLWNATPTPLVTLALVREVLEGHPYLDLELIV